MLLEIKDLRISLLNEQIDILKAMTTFYEDH